MKESVERKFKRACSDYLVIEGLNCFIQTTHLVYQGFVDKDSTNLEWHNCTLYSHNSGYLRTTVSSKTTTRMPVVRFACQIQVEPINGNHSSILQTE